MIEASDESRLGRDQALPDETRPPLRVGLFVEPMQARWRRRVIEEILASGDGEISLVIFWRPGPEVPRPGWMARLYQAIDRRVFRRGPDALDRVDSEDLLRGIPSIEVAVSGGDESFLEADVERIVPHELDVLICLASELRGIRLSRVARFGTWAYRFGEGCAEPVGLREVLGGRPSTAVSLNILGAGPTGEDRILFDANLKTHRLSSRRHADHLGAVASQFVGRELRRLRREGSLAPSAGLGVPLSPAPSNAEMARLAVRFAGGLAAEATHRVLYQDQWVLAYSPRGEWAGPRPDLASLRLLVPPRDRFWADPFPVEIDGATHVYFEEYLDRTGKGHISVLEIDALGRAGEPRVALDRPYHLSYPFIFSWQGELYMIPESTASGSVELYRCAGGPDRWEFDRYLLQEIRIADVTLEEHDGLWWMFGNVPVPGAHNDVEELHLFLAKTPLGPWRAHPANPVKSDVASTRPAGRLYRRDDTWYRPAQDCTLGYGHSIVLNRVETWNLREYRESPASRIDPDWAPGLDRTHTFNALGSLFVADARIARPRLSLGRKFGEAREPR